MSTASNASMDATARAGFAISRRPAQRGAATLVIVMSLLFSIAMMAAYASRNLLFEQRIAGNFYRASVAQETAEAGVEWALAALNGLHVDGACRPGGSSGLRQRYLAIDAQSRTIAVRAGGIVADCRRASDAWSCQCPAHDAWSAPAALPPAEQLQPSFGLRFAATSRAGVVRIVSTGCSSSRVDDCRSGPSELRGLLGRADVETDAALIPALKMPPALPLTVRGAIDAAPDGVGLHNDDMATLGLLLQAGGDVTGLVDERLDSLPGTPGRQAVLGNDAALARLDGAAMFARYFGMTPARYADQPAVRPLTCADDCTAALAAAHAAGADIVWVRGPLRLSGNAELGSASAPLLIVANGDATLEGPLRLTGLLYIRGDLHWSNGGATPALLSGALLTEGAARIAGRVDLWYRPPVLRELNNRAGSFVRVPGSWWN